MADVSSLLDRSSRPYSISIWAKAILKKIFYENGHSKKFKVHMDESINQNGLSLKVNGHRLKAYIDGPVDPTVEVLELHAPRA